MNKLKSFDNFIISLFIILAPGIMLMIPDIRRYILGTFHFSVIYNIAIIAIYIFGSLFTLISTLVMSRGYQAIKEARSTQQYHGAISRVYRLLSLSLVGNQSVGDADISRNIASLREVVRKLSSQHISLISSCANISPLIGLLGTFAGLSITIGSVGDLLGSGANIRSDGDTADTLQVLIGVVASLSEPLRGMNVAFVSSIYGVTASILLLVQTVFVRNASTALQLQLQGILLENQKSAEKVYRPLRLESETLSDLKAMFAQYLVDQRNDMAQSLAQQSKAQEHLAGLDATLGNVFGTLDSLKRDLGATAGNMESQLQRLEQGQKQGRESAERAAAQQLNSVDTLHTMLHSNEACLKANQSLLDAIKQNQTAALEAQRLWFSQTQERGQQQLHALGELIGGQHAIDEAIRTRGEAHNALLTRIEQGLQVGIANAKAVVEWQYALAENLLGNLDNCERHLKHHLTHLEGIGQSQASGFAAQSQLLNEIKDAEQQQSQAHYTLFKNIEKNQMMGDEQRNQLLNAQAAQKILLANILQEARKQNQQLILLAQQERQSVAREIPSRSGADESGNASGLRDKEARADAVTGEQASVKQNNEALLSEKLSTMWRQLFNKDINDKDTENDQ